VSINAIVVSMLEEFFKRLRKTRALKEELSSRSAPIGAFRFSTALAFR